MKKRLSFLLAALALVAVIVYGCTDPTPQPEPIDNTPEEQNEQPEEPADLVDLKPSVPVTDNWIYDKRPDIVIHVENPNSVPVTAEAKVRIATDFKEVLMMLEESAEVPANGEADIHFTTPEDLAPGFYRASCFVNNKTARIFVFGVNPTEIVSAPDKQPDFDEFWETAKAQLPAIGDETVTLYEIPAKSTAQQKVYMVEMQSVPDGPEGDPVLVHGYYLEPQDMDKSYPVLMHFFGYDDQRPSGKMACPSGSASPKYAEFYLSTRGQMINNRTADHRSDGLDMDFANIYGDWFAYEFGHRDSYYYRGAFMDCVQAVRFMASRANNDMTNLFAEGSSQGGAFSYAAAALSDYPFTAIAPNVAFLGDFPDYFRIVSWPGDTARNNQGSMSDDQMYAFLSYFDTKNLATRISCAVFASIGLQDGTCPPHTNIAPYNNLLSTDKEMLYNPEMQHSYPTGWENKYLKFFGDRIK